MRRLAALLLFATAPVFAQTLPDPFTWRIDPNVVYRVASGQELKLDVYAPRKAASPMPVVVFIHGGGWVVGAKESDFLYAAEYLTMGLPLVNVEYRLARVAGAPAAVEDCRCALRWVVRNAAKYGFDPNRIIVSGGSAGGHLALMTGMLRASDGFDRSCTGAAETRWSGSDKSDPRVAAIVNWFGITDVRDLVEDGGNPRSYAIEWIGNADNAAALAKRVSPLTYVRADTPPIFTVHGDADEVVPPSQATRLHDALKKAGAPNHLLMPHGAGHGALSPEQAREAIEAVRAFLKQHNLLP